MEYYTAFKRDEILTQYTTWLNVGDMMLSKISQAEKGKNSMIPPARGRKTVKTGHKAE